MRKFAISDIHGCYKSFRNLVEEVINLKKKDELYLLGDFVDRGPDSKGVIDYILKLRKKGYNVTGLRGNHEDMMLTALHGGRNVDLWTTNGGKNTLKSFGVKKVSKIPQEYWDFIHTLEYYVKVDNYILVHAGLNFKAPNPLHDLKGMLWIRWWENDVDYDWLGDSIIVHGHTPLSKKLIKTSLNTLDTRQYIDIDAGCYAVNRSGMGNLCAFDLGARKLYFQANIDT